MVQGISQTVIFVVIGTLLIVWLIELVTLFLRTRKSRKRPVMPDVSPSRYNLDIDLHKAENLFDASRWPMPQLSKEEAKEIQDNFGSDYRDLLIWGNFTVHGTKTGHNISKNEIFFQQIENSKYTNIGEPETGNMEQ